MGGGQWGCNRDHAEHTFSRLTSMTEQNTSSVVIEPLFFSSLVEDNPVPPINNGQQKPLSYPVMVKIMTLILNDRSIEIDR